MKKFYAETSQGTIHGRRMGTGRPPVVLLHRTPVSSSSFDLMMRWLSGHGQASIAFDTPGFGASFLPEGNPCARDYGAWFLEALDDLQVEQFHLAAHHTGGHFAAEMAAMAPGRVLSLTLSGVLLAEPEARRKMRSELPKACGSDKAGDYLLHTFKLMRGLFLDPETDPALIHAETLGALVSGHGRDIAFDAIFAQDFSGLMSEILQQGQVKVQVVQASDDPLSLNGMLQSFRTLFPRVPVHLTGPAFLALPERQPGTFARSIQAFTDEATHSMKNRRYELRRTETGYELDRNDGEVPQPGPGEVLVQVHSVSLNRRDLGVRDLSYPANDADRFTPLSDAAGEIVAVGSGVTDWQAGDRVASTFFQNYLGGRLHLPAVLSSLGAGVPGVLADHVVLSQNGIVPVPDHWTYSDAACLPCAGVTAWSALRTLGRIEPGDHVLILGTGGVALFALQIAAASGARPIILSSSEKKIERARSMGAVDAINYRQTPDWSEKVREMTSGAGVQHVVELGGAGTLAQSVASLGLQGHLALVGALDGFGGDISTMPLIFSALRVSAVMVGSRADHLNLIDFMVEHDLKPVIDSTFSFADADAAYRRAGEGAFGKVLIELRA